MVRLKDDDLKYYVKQTTNLVFSGQDLQIALTQILPITRGKRSTGASARIVETPLGEATVSSVKLYPPNIEVYHLESGNYMGIEYYDDPVFEKLRLKVAHAASEAEVLNELKQKKLFNWESESTAEIPSRVLNTVAQGPAGGSIVKTTLFSDTSSLASSITIPNAYDWENTVQMDLDVQNLTAKIIEVNNKISNTSSYKIKMIEDESETSGIFQLSGTGLFNGMYFYLQITNTDNIAGLLSMNLSQTDVKDSSKSTPVPYQDRLKAQQPHRVVINLEKRGVSWLGIQEDGYYDNLKTTNYSFNSQNRTVRIKIITNSTPMTSSYKLTMTSNESEDFGVFKLEKTSITLPPGTTADNDLEYPFSEKFVSVKLGSGVDSTRGRLDITDTNPADNNRSERKALPFNLSEQSALPSGNKIIKHMGAQTPWVQLNTPNGYYIEDNTEIWNVDSDVMEVTIMRISTSGNATTTNANKFPITMENDVSSSEGGFKLGTPMKVDNGSGSDYPNLTTPTYENCYFYVVTGTGPKADEARITNSLDSVADAKQKLPLQFNFHTLENAPLSYAVIENIYKNAKDKGHTYIQYEAPATAGNGKYLPYKTTEYSFLLDPLQVQITEVREDNTRTTHTYPIQMMKNNSVTEGAFKLLGSGPLSGRIVAIGVDQAFPNPPSTPTGRRFRLYMNPGITDTDTVESALQELKKLKDAHQFTHDIKQESLLSDSLLTPKTDIWSMLYDPTPSSPNYTEMLYDRKNTSNFIFDASARTVTVKSSISGINNQESYGYEVMEALPSEKQIILLLNGNGLHGGKYLGFKNDAGTSGHAQITISDTVGSVKTSLATAHTNYRKESTLTFSSNVFKDINWTSDTDDSFIKVQENGIWSSSDTEELFFNYDNMTLQAVETKNGVVGRSYTYNIIMLSSTENIADGATSSRKGKFYLKSADNDATAPLHKKYGRIQVEDGSSPKKIRLGRGATYTEAETEFNKLNQTSPVPPNAWNFRDKTSTAIDIKSIITASAKVWTRLKLENNNFYYYDSQDTENWTFNAENKQVTIQSISGSSTTEEIYDIGMRSSIDDNNGIFVLSGAGKKYDQKVVRLELGTDTAGNLDKDQNARIVVGESRATADLSETDAIDKYNRLKSQNEWNFRENHLATRPNRAIAEAIKVKEWYSLENNTVPASLSYDQSKFNSLKFQVYTNDSGTEKKLTNIIIQRTSTTDAHAAVTMNYKMYNDISDQRAIIQLVGGHAPGNTGLSKYTNKYMALELGTAINDRLMKIGIGDSPEAAQNALNLQVIWNYMDKEMATANDRVIEEAIKRGSNIWISYRDNIVDDSAPNPSYSSANATNVLFIRGNKTIKMQYVTTQNGITETLEFIYGYTMIEDESTTKGVLRLSGYGEFADMFMAGELGSGVKQNRAQIAFGTDTEKSKQALAQLQSSGKWNLFERKSLLIGHQVLTTLVAQHQTKGSVVKVTGGPGVFDVYDEKNTKKYTFDTSQTDPTVTIETIVTGVVASHTYTVEMIQDRSSTEGIFQLMNSGSPDHGKYFGIKIDNDNIHLFSDNDRTVIEGYFTSNMPQADHRYENDIKKSDWREILNALSTGSIVRLDQDGIYLSHQTEHWNYNAQNDDLTIVTVSVSTTTTTYKAIPITNIDVSGGEYKKGIFFLNSDNSSDSYRKKYIGVTILSDQKQIKLVSHDTLTDAISGLNAQTSVNASTLSSVNISDSVLQDIGSISKVWNTLLDPSYVFDQRNTIQYTFDIKERILTKKVITSGTAAADIYYRIKIHNENNAGNTNVLFQVISSTLSGKITPSGDSDINKFMALGIPPDRDALFYSLHQNSNTAMMNRNNNDPFLIAEAVANNSTRVLDLWGTVNDSLWFKTDNAGEVSPTEVTLNFDLNKGGEAGTPGPNYVYNLYMRATKGTPPVVEIVAGKPFFVRTLKDISPTSSIIRIYGQNPSAAGTFASGSGVDYQAGKQLLSQISNKFFGIEIGRGVDHFKAKIVEHSTIEGAQNLLETQKDYNYRADAFINSTLAFMTNLAFKNPDASSKEIQTWLDLSAESDPAGYAYDPNNHTNWTIDVANRTLTVNIVGSSPKSYIYEYHKIYSWKSSVLKGLVALDGIGPYKNKILLIHRKEKTDNKAIFAIGDDFTTLSNQLPTDSFSDSSANLYTLDSKRIDLGVINTIGNNDSVVSLYDFQTTTPRRIYDPEETTEYSFNTDQRKATIYKVSGGINSAYTFDLVMIENTSPQEGIFQLVNGPPSASGFDRWFYGMKVHNNNVVIVSNTTKDAVKTAMQSIQATDDNAAHFRRKTSVPSNNSQILSDLSSGGSIVLLDENRAYRDQTTDEYSFDASTKSLQIIKKVDNAITGSFVYKVVVVEDYNTSAAGADQFKGTLLLKSSSTGAPLDKNFLAVQKHHENTSGNSYQDSLSPNTFRITNDVSKVTAESQRDTAAWRWHRKAPLNIDDTAFRKLGTLFEGKWATLGDTGQNKYLYDRRNTQEMKFDYNKKTLTVTNIVPRAGSSTEVDQTVGEYTVWITNIQGSTDNDAQKISFLLYHVSGAYNTYNGKWGSIKIPTAEDSVYRGIGFNTLDEAKAQRDNGDPTMIPLLYATNSSDAISNLNRLGKNDCWHPINQDNKTAKGQLVYDPNPGEDNCINPGPVYAVNFNLGAWDSAPSSPVLIGSQSINNIPGEELSRFFVRVISSTDPYNAVFRTYTGVRKGTDNTHINKLTNSSSLFNVSNVYHALTVGTGPNLYKAKIARGDTPAQALANLNALPYYNYVNKQALGSIQNTINIFNRLSSGQNWSGSVNGQNMLISLVDASISQRLISVRHAGENVHVTNTYQMEHLYSSSDHEHDNGTVKGSSSGQRTIFKLVGFGSYGNKIVRVIQTADVAGKKTIKLVIGSGIPDNNKVIDIDKQWASLNSHNMTQTP